jgi:polyvinyl alcohol dehydrogenase (cytochrome)
MRLRVTHWLLALIASVLPVMAFAAQCASAPDMSGTTQWTGWGNGNTNSRHSPAGISVPDAAQLQLQWAFAFPGVTSVVGNPVVHGDVVFIGVDSGEVYAIDINTACVYWVFKAEAGVRTAAAVGEVNGKTLVFFGDRNANTYAVDATTGQQQWKVEVEAHAAATLTGSPQFVRLDNVEHPARLIVPVSSNEEGMAAVPTYKCCSFRGSIVSLDAATGETIWQTYAIQSPVRSTGENTQGPSGAASWSAPTIDLDGKRIFVTTGDAYSAPADIATDAVMGLDLVDGHILWINQGTPNDIWTVQCRTPNAAKNCGPDHDYGSPAMLVSASGRQFLVAGQKSGVVRAFTLAGGSPLWQTALVDNTSEFGGKVIWGGANDGDKAYFGLGSGGIAAVRLNDGTKAWFTELAPTAEMAKHPGQDGPITVGNDVLISGGWDGILRALSTANGAVLWQYNTATTFTSVNGIEGKGGSMGSAGSIIVGKRLLVPSGYIGVKGGMPGNALLMFSP